MGLTFSPEKGFYEEDFGECRSNDLENQLLRQPSPLPPEEHPDVDAFLKKMFATLDDGDGRRIENCMKKGRKQFAYLLSGNGPQTPGEIDILNFIQPQFEDEQDDA
jgi:hypothetical protein